ncbi:MAG: hypothetical protein LBH98_07205 [Chitinispirillales bacterium]|nr:hypothetical protein [Chitinispirillales bacterium]
MKRVSFTWFIKCLVSVSAVCAAVFVAGCSKGEESGNRRPTNPDSLIILGNSALRNEKYDEAVEYYEAAFEADNNHTKAIIYSTIAKIAKISVDRKVVDLFKNRFGFTNYPNRLNALLSDDWLTKYPEEYILWSYRDEEIGKWVYWHDEWYVNSGYYPDIQKIGYYYQEYDYNSYNYLYFFVSDSPIYEKGSEYLLPGLTVPNWIKGGSDSWYNETLMSTDKAHSFETWCLLLFANAVDKNTAGLNTVLDELISSVFGGSFVDACNRIKRLENNKTAAITLDRDFIEALYLDEIIDEYDLIGWAEVNAITSCMVGVKACLEWMAAYDWDTDLNFLKYAWKSDENDFYEHIKTIDSRNLPFNNNFLNARPGKMGVAKASFVTAIQGIKASYDAIITSNLYPTEVKNAYPTINDGIGKLLSAIQTGGKFYIPQAPTEGSWPTSGGTDVLLGVDMGLFFQEGYFSLKNVFETENGKPTFYADGVKLTLSNYGTAIRDAEDYIGLKFKTATINNIVFDFPELYEEVPELTNGSDGWIVGMFPPALAKTLFEKYYNK